MINTLKTLLYSVIMLTIQFFIAYVILKVVSIKPDWFFNIASKIKVVVPLPEDTILTLLFFIPSVIVVFYITDKIRDKFNL